MIDSIRKLVNLFLAGLFFTSTLAGCVNDREPDNKTSENQKDIETVRKAVVRTGIAFNMGETDTLLSYYAKDIKVSFPGTIDTDYDQFVNAYRNMLNRPAGVHVSTQDSIEEIIASGNLAMVRVTWITTTTVDSTQKTSVRRSRDLQVWRRESNGLWKFARGMWFRLGQQN